MTTLIAQVAANYTHTMIDDVSIRFFDGDDEFVLTHDIMYASCDGQLLPGCKTVFNISQVVKFINDRK